MDTTIWGPPFWFILHTISINYPEKPTYVEKQQHLLFFESLKTILPCEICRGHYKDFLKNKPLSPYLDSNKALMKWVLECHNNVNKINGEKVWTFEEMKKYYDNIYNNQENFKCQFIKKKNKSKFTYNTVSNIIIIILFIIIFCFYIFKF